MSGMAELLSGRRAYVSRAADNTWVLRRAPGGRTGGITGGGGVGAGGDRDGQRWARTLGGGQ